MLGADSWVIPRGAPNRDVAMSFVNFATRAVPTANYSRLESFGPVNQDAFALLRPDIVADCQTPRTISKSSSSRIGRSGRKIVEMVTAQFEDWLLNPDGSPTAEANRSSTRRPSRRRVDRRRPSARRSRRFEA